MFKKKKSVALVVILIILLILLAIYIGVKEYNKYIERVETEAYQQGMEDAIMSMYEKGVNCEMVTLLIGDDSVDFFPVDCLEKKDEE